MEGGQLADLLAATLGHFVAPQVVGRVVFLLVLLGAVPAMAVQIHDAPEGYYGHQMAHLFFAVALVFLLYLLHVRPLGTGKAWRLFRLSLLFFLLWNIWTFTAHWFADQLPHEAFSSPDNLWTNHLISDISASSWFYYVTRFDHFLCLPAIWFLLQSLKTFCLDIARKNEMPGEEHD